MKEIDPLVSSCLLLVYVLVLATKNTFPYGFLHLLETKIYYMGLSHPSQKGNYLRKGKKRQGPTLRSHCSMQRTGEGAPRMSWHTRRRFWWFWVRWGVKNLGKRCLGVWREEMEEKRRQQNCCVFLHVSTNEVRGPGED